MADTESLTLDVLKQIRDEVRTTNVRVDKLEAALSQRIDATNERLDRLEHRVTESEIRLATELTAVANAVRQLQDVFVSSLNVKKQVDDHERRIAQLEQHASH